MLELTHLDLFAGIGGFTLAFEAEDFRTVAFSEINADKILVYEHHFPGVPNLGDIKAITRNEIGRIDVLTGGVPCQPASALGQMRGSLDERWLWPEALRMVGLFRPRYGVFENPPSLLVLEGGRAWNGIVSGLVALGYDCWWDVFPAAAFGAGHLRERVLITIADTQSQQEPVQHHERARRVQQPGLQLPKPPYDCPQDNAADALHRENRQRCDSAGHHRPTHQTEQAGADHRHFTPAHPDRTGLQGHPGHGAHSHRRTGTRRPVAPPDLRGRVSKADWWHEINTGVPVLAHGLSAKLVEAAARCAGDAVVPQVIQPIAHAIRLSLLNPILNRKS